ncbi:MAG TPA: HAMP domain-containing sensor histidine kinase [Candidatus Micrarchaeia archaeon]|nr:HAMP domain-containing sensor histidine kinase [Candidatus Micrarchaeia archaeon]
MITQPSGAQSRPPLDGSNVAEPSAGHRRLGALSVGLVAALDDGVLLLDPSLRVLSCNPALARRMPLSVLCDPSGHLRVPGLVRLARDGLRGSDRAIGMVELDTRDQVRGPLRRRARPARVERPPGPEAPARFAAPAPEEVAGDAPADRPTSDPSAGEPAGGRWRPLVRAVALGSPIHACALVLRDPGPIGTMGSARELIATLSHELKSPLFHAQQAVEVLTQYQVPHDPEFGPAVDRAAWSIRHISAVVRDLVDLLHLDDPREVVVHQTPVDVVRLVREVGETYGALAGARGITLEIGVDSGPPPIPRLSLDEPLITRALGNLIDNALKYAPTTGPVTVGVRRAGSLVNLEVTDRGPGIALGDQRRIFEPFVRLPGAAPISGSGLGLALAHRIARSHGGTLTVESRPGMGSTFRLSLLVPPGT